MLWIVAVPIGIFTCIAIYYKYLNNNPYAAQKATFRMVDKETNRTFVSSKGSCAADAFADAFSKIEQKALSSVRSETIQKNLSVMEQACNDFVARYPKFDILPYQKRIDIVLRRVANAEQKERAIQQKKASKLAEQREILEKKQKVLEDIRRAKLHEASANKVSKTKRGRPTPPGPEAEAHKRERSLLTKSLRYDILKRDGFKCQICGRSAKDGVKLHVDHIFPVSKGGKTIPENLRTLCEECNLGKKDKIEVKIEKSATEKEEAYTYAVGDFLVALHRSNIEFVDKRSVGGSIWIQDSDAARLLVNNVLIDGVKPVYAKSSRALGGAPGWYIK